MKNRLSYLDNLKVALTFLVIAHHAGQPFGGSKGFWYYHTTEQIRLGPFFAVNAGFFMSLFFFVSAYFLPASYEKKGPARFMKDRLKRLGLPVLFGFLLMIPVLMYFYYINFRNYADIGFLDYYLNVYFGLGQRPADWTGPSWPDMQFAHLWFIEHLLVYAVLYTVIRTFMSQKGKRGPKTVKPLSNGIVFLFTCTVALLTFLVRIEYPIDRWVGFLAIIQTEFAHVPQYASFFVAGILAYRNNWLHTLSRRVGMTWLIIGLTLAAAHYSGNVKFRAPGGLGWNAFAYAFFETFLCTGLCLGLLYLFRETMNRAGKLSNKLAACAYTVYVLHVPVLVALQYASGGWRLSVLGKFLLVTGLGTVLTFIISYAYLASVKRIFRNRKGADLPVPTSGLES